MSKKARPPKIKFFDSRKIVPKKELQGMDLKALSERVSYEPASYHKRTIFGGVQPTHGGNLKYDKSHCPIHLREDVVLSWLKDAVSRGAFCAFPQNGFPERIWFKDGAIVYEAKHHGNGKYHGFPINKWPNSIEQYYAE